MTDKLRVLAMADIHDAWHPSRILPDADICVVAGDLTNMGVFSRDERQRAERAMQALAQRYRVLLWVPGNHDFGLDSRSLQTFPPAHNLLDGPWGPRQEIVGVSLTVAYVLPSLAYTWCHMTADEAVERRVFMSLPPCEILVSHGPPFGVCDNDGYDIRTKEVCHVGSPELLAYINRHQPKLVICGHSHGGVGEAMVGNTRVVNVARTFQLLEVAR